MSDLIPSGDFGQLLLLSLIMLAVLTLGTEPIVRSASRADASSRRRQSAVNLRRRVRAWWGVWIVAAVALSIGSWAVVVMFALLAFFALREFIALAPTDRGDHWALLAAFFVIGPLQFAVAALGRIDWLFGLVPIYAFVALSAAAATRGAPDRYLERVATIQWALVACVFGLSFAPALLFIDAPGDERTLVLLLLGLVIIADIFRVVFARPAGRRLVNPAVSGSRTWEGGIAGLVTGTAFAIAAASYTPLSVGEAALASSVALAAGFAGGFSLAAIRTERSGALRRRRDEGATIEITGAVLAHLGSLLFAAPVFFHLAWVMAG